MPTFTQQQLQQMEQQHGPLFARRYRHLRLVALVAAVVLAYYLYFFAAYGMSYSRFINGNGQILEYFARMFVWRDLAQWPFGYYLEQIGITLAIVFGGTLTATLVALPLSFLAARNIMVGPWALAALLLRKLFDVLRGIDMAIWGMVFVRAIGMGPLAGAMALFVQDLGLLGKLFAESHEAVDGKPSRSLTAVGAGAVVKHRFGIFTQSFPVFLALSLYQIESNTRSAAVLGFVGAGGIGLVYAESMRMWRWDVVTFITLVMVLIVMTMDKISAVLRKKYITGETLPLFEGPLPQRAPQP